MLNGTITVVRHGHSPETEGVDERNRPLSEIGMQQARDLRAKLGDPDFDWIVTSPMDRTRQTGLLVAGRLPDLTVVYPDVTIEPTLWTPEGEDGRILEQMFEEMGYASIFSYEARYASMNGEKIKCLYRVGKTAWQAIFAQIKAENLPNDFNVMVVGHAIYLPIMGMVAGERFARILYNYNMGECGAFRITIKNGEVTAIEIVQ